MLGVGVGAEVEVVLGGRESELVNVSKCFQLEKSFSSSSEQGWKGDWEVLLGKLSSR